MQPSHKVIGAIGAAVALAWCSLAWSRFIPPPPPYPLIEASVVVTPAGPSPAQSITLAIYDRYGAGEWKWMEPLAAAKSLAWRIEGNTIIVTAELLDPGPSDPPRPKISLPPLPSGRYTVVYDGSAGLTHPEVHKATREFIVSDSNVVTVVEFHNAQLDHYFITADAEEIAKLDQGTIRGWRRTGESFRAYSAQAATVAQIATMCRFYGLPGAGIDSHFFSSRSHECDEVSRRWPDAWKLETRAALGGTIDVALPATTTCGDLGQPLYRLYNNRPDVNHRYTVSRQTRDRMVAQGWIMEGGHWDESPEVPGDIKQFEMCVFR